MREFYDLLVFGQECIEFGEKIGFKKACFSEVNYCEPKNVIGITPLKGKINIFLGGDLKINQAAVRKKIQVLLNPVNEKTKNFDSATARIAKENNICIGISLSSILEKKGIDRIKLLKNLMFMVKICMKMKTDLTILSGARNKLEMRPPRDLASVLIMLGLTEPQALWAISETPKALLEELE